MGARITRIWRRPITGRAARLRRSHRQGGRRGT